MLSVPGRPPRPRALARAIGLALLFSCFGALAALAAATGKIQGKIVASDTGEPLGFADVLLIPTDTTMSRVGGLTNADGTFLLQAPPGRYTLQIRALSYARKQVEGIVIAADQLLPFDTALAPEAIQQDEVVVEAKAKQNSEASMLSARRKATSVGDAVSAEQVRRSPDKDAAEVLRRVTGLSVADGKYVFVRGLGERYSSVEVDGVRIASPEQNKRVVPLDLVPANLLENIVVQKTYTADRPGEFGGGDVQVRTKDFPGKRTISFSIAQGYAEGVTFEKRMTYPGAGGDMFGFGTSFRKIPDEVARVAGNQPLAYGNFKQSTLNQVARSFKNLWSPASDQTVPNGGYSATYADELRIFNQPLGLLASWTLMRYFDQEDLSHRYFQSSMTDTVYDYDVTSHKESATLGGIAGLSYRFSPGHTLHLRGFYNNSADDEVRVYEGWDINRQDALDQNLVHHNTRLMYVRRNVLSGTVNGQHTLPSVLGTSVDWKLTRSQARREQPDRREVMYDRNYYYDGNGNPVEYWALASTGIREYGDLKEDGWGGTINATLPYKLGALGNGKVVMGLDRQTKERDNYYRRFNFVPRAIDTTLPPDSLFDYSHPTDTSGFVREATLDIDNYVAEQRVNAAFVSADIPLGRRLRANLGVRVESGFQDVTSFDLFDPTRTTKGTLDDTDLMPSANLTWSLTEALNLRLGASRTVSRPDLNELSPSPALDYIGGFRVAGNPELKRALIDNYDVRIEAFPGLSEVLAAGFFYKKLHEPIEQAIQGGSAPILVPRNSDWGENLGVELEARAALDRLWRPLAGFAINSNASFISSTVHLKDQGTRLGTAEHPLQGQADYLVNAALTYVTPGNTWDVAVMLGSTGKRLKTLAYDPLPDIYNQPFTSLDAITNVLMFRSYRLKLAAKNLLDPTIRQLQGDTEVSSHKAGRGYTISLHYGS